MQVASLAEARRLRVDNEGAEEEDAEVDGVGEDDFESDDFDDFEEDAFDEDEFEEDGVNDFAVDAVEEDEAGERHQRTKISSGQGWAHGDGRFVTFTCDVKGGVCCEFRWYSIELDWHVVRKPRLQVMLNVVTADMWLEASCEDAGKPLTFHGTQATSLA